VDVQVQIANGNVVFTVVGLGDKAVAESRERVRAALNASGLAMPAKRITVNLNNMYYHIVNSSLRMAKTE
jgi:magnesium chelatase family protein